MSENELDANLTESHEEQQEEAAVQQKADSRRRQTNFLAGLLVMIMAVIGLVGVGEAAVRGIDKLINDTDRKSRMERFIYPVVICDPPTTEQSKGFHSDTMIEAAIWDIILYADRSRYEMDFDYMIVPQVDVEYHAAMLFGSDLELEHRTISTSDYSFYYDEEHSSYRVPEKPDYFCYSPVVEEVSGQGTVYTLRVGYIPPTPAWRFIKGDITPEKYMVYVVDESGPHGMYLVSIKNDTETGSESGVN